ncbi:MAG: hypothetical protein ACRDRP_20350, partial [Pseudonocardiaceae bacterium]
MSPSGELVWVVVDRVGFGLHEEATTFLVGLRARDLSVCQGPVGTAQWRSWDLPGDGHGICPVMAMGSALCWPSPAVVG